MAIETTIYTPRTLGKLITRMPPVHTFFRDTLFKNRRTFPTKSVDVDFKKGSRALAPFVHPKVGGKVVPNSGYQTKTYTSVLLAPDKITTVDDLLNRSAGENPYSGRTPAERAVEKLADDLRELNEMIVRREEWMAATAIFTGQKSSTLTSPTRKPSSAPKRSGTPILPTRWAIWSAGSKPSRKRAL